MGTRCDGRFEVGHQTKPVPFPTVGPSVLSIDSSLSSPALRLHLNTVSRLGRGGVVTVLDDTGVEEVLVQVVDVLEHAELTTDNNVVDGTQVLGVFRKADTTGVRNNRHTELLCDEEDSEDFVDTAHTAGIDLADIDGTLLQELLEDDTVLAHFTGGNTDVVGLEGFADGLVAEDVVGAGGLFDEPGLELGELLHVLDGLRDGPDLGEGMLVRILGMRELRQDLPGWRRP